MDFGSFLRQRQQKQQESGSIGSHASSSNDSWAVNRPFTNADRKGLVADPVFFDGPSEVETWNQPDPYQQDVDCFSSEPVGGQFIKYEPGEKGFRGRGMKPNSSGRNRGTRSYAGGFGRGTRSGMDEFQPWTEAPPFGQPTGYGDGVGYVQHHSGNEGYVGYGDGSDTIGQSENQPAEQSMEKQGSDAHVVRDEQGPRNVDMNKKPEKEIILKTDEEKKALEEFDIMQVNINWTHFCISKRMLFEASSTGKQPISAKKNYDITKLEFYCKLCDVQTVSAGNFHDHMVGKRHKMKAEYELDADDPGANSKEKGKDDKSWNTYGGTIGFELKEEEKDTIIVDKQKDAAYEKQYYENFDLSQVNIDWSSNEITESMLKEACFETKVPKYEERCFDIFSLQFYCKLCDVQSTSIVTFFEHLSGKKHKSKAAKDMNPANAKGGEDDGKNEHDLSEQENAILQEFDIFQVKLNWDHYNITKEMLIEASTEGIPGLSQKKRKNKDIDLTKLEFYCKLCASQMASAGNFYDHLVGRKHKQGYQDHIKGMTSSQQTMHLKPEDLGKKSILEDTFTETEDQRPIIGLNYVTELHSIYDIWCLCNLCGVKFRSKVARNHVVGLKHRLLYMRNHHSDVYENLKKLHEKNASIYSEVERQSLLKEESDGRGKPSLKCFNAKQEEDAEEDESKSKDNTTKVNNVQGYIQWVNSEWDDSKKNFMSQFKERSMSPILIINRNSKTGDRSADNKPTDFDNPSELRDHLQSLMDPVPHRLLFPTRGRRPPQRGRRPLPLHALSYEHDPMYPPHLPPPHHDPYLNRDLLSRDRFMDRDPLLRDRFLDRDPLLRDRYLERDALLRDRYLERDPLLRERYMEREKDMYRNRRSLTRDRDVDRGPYFDPDHPSNLYRDPPNQWEMRTYKDSEAMKLRPGAEQPYLDPDPLKRPRKTEKHFDPNPCTRALASEPFIDPDPLKRVLPSQKVKAKPVVIDYGHGKEEKSEKSKAKEWEDDINDILDSGRKSKGPDSLALLSSSYSSPKRERSPKKERSPPYARLTKPLPFEKSYLDRAKDFDLLSGKSKKRESDSSHFKRRHSPSPDYSARNPDYPTFRYNRKGRDSPFKSSDNRKGCDSPPFKSSETNFDRISISSESPPWVESPKKSTSLKNVRRYVKSPKFKKKMGPKRSESSSSSRSTSSQSSSRSLDSPPRSSKHLRRKSPSGSARKSKLYLSSLKQSNPPVSSHAHHAPISRSRSPFKSFRRSRSKSPRSVPSAPPPRPSLTAPLPKSLPPAPPLPAGPPPKETGRHPRSKSPSVLLPPPTSLPTRPPPSSRSPPRKLSCSKSPLGPFPDSLPPRPLLKSRSYPSPPPRTESKNLVAVDNEDAQAERIANMLLNMKSSIVGSEMDDPHAALQALLSSQELTEALLGTTIESQGQGGEMEGANISSDQQSSGLETEWKKAPQKSTSSREKVAFAFAGKSSVARNVPQTFLEEESSDENN